MGIAYFGWGTDTYGARNVGHGEYDTCRYFTMTLGLPVYSSFRGCIHVIDTRELQPAARRERIRSFLTHYAGWTEAQAHYLPEAVALPLRPLRSLKGMAWLESLVWLTGILAGIGAFVTLAIAQQP